MTVGLIEESPSADVSTARLNCPNHCVRTRIRDRQDPSEDYQLPAQTAAGPVASTVSASGDTNPEGYQNAGSSCSDRVVLVD
jgi:hypothetical protein